MEELFDYDLKRISFEDLNLQKAMTLERCYHKLKKSKRDL